MPLSALIKERRPSNNARRGPAGRGALAMNGENRRDRLGAAQVDALFDFILVAAPAAAAAAAILAGGLAALGQVEPWTAAAWVAYMSVCALANLALRALYRRSPLSRETWRAWGLAFSIINLAVGLGFGWAPVGLPDGERVGVVFDPDRDAVRGRRSDYSVRPLSADLRPVLSGGDRSLCDFRIFRVRSSPASSRARIDAELHRRHGRAWTPGQSRLRATGAPSDRDRGIG